MPYKKSCKLNLQLFVFYSVKGVRLSINEVGVSTINVHCALTACADERYLDIELSYVAVIGILKSLRLPSRYYGCLDVGVFNCCGVYLCHAYEILDFAVNHALSENVVCKS